MGVTIYYKGTVNDPEEIGEFVEQLVDFAQALSWRTKLWTIDLSDQNRASLLIKEDGSGLNGHKSLTGIALYPHEDCEPLWLTFGSDGALTDPVAMKLAGGENQQERWLSTKTQFAPIHVHTGIIKLLYHLKKRYIADLEVYDEGGYWESDNIHELKRRLDSISHALDILGSALSEDRSGLTGSSTPEELVEIIERILKNKFGGGNG